MPTQEISVKPKVLLLLNESLTGVEKIALNRFCSPDECKSFGELETKWKEVRRGCAVIDLEVSSVSLCQALKLARVEEKQVLLLGADSVEPGFIMTARPTLGSVLRGLMA